MIDRADYLGRAGRIVDRVLPALPPAHGWYERGAFIAASQRHGERERLFWRTFARLRAKAEGGRPFLMLPKDSHAMVGGPMWTVARELELEAIEP